MPGVCVISLKVSFMFDIQKLVGSWDRIHAGILLPFLFSSHPHNDLVYSHSLSNPRRRKSASRGTIPSDCTIDNLRITQLESRDSELNLTKRNIRQGRVQVFAGKVSTGILESPKSARELFSSLKSFFTEARNLSSVLFQVRSSLGSKQSDNVTNAMTRRNPSPSLHPLIARL